MGMFFADRAARHDPPADPLATTPWLDHLRPGMPSPEVLELQERIRGDIERRVSELAGRLSREGGMETALASSVSACLHVHQALEVQRDASPDGYRAMLTALFLGDPEMAETWAIIGRRRRSGVAAAFNAGAGMALAFAAAASWGIAGERELALVFAAGAAAFLAQAWAERRRLRRAETRAIGRAATG